MSLDFPKFAQELFKPYRYKVLYGGRGSGKSFSMAKALLLIGASKKIKVLCVREFQNSISESVHSLLVQQMEAMGLSGFYRYTNTSIIGANGTEFLFKGVRHNVSSIKSIPDIDILWIEEGDTISQNSWEILVPTIRKDGSEIWVSYNPNKENDPTHIRFVNTKDPPGNAYIKEVNWQDNPWFPEVLKIEKDKMYKTNPDLAEHIWGGKCKTHSESQIFNGKWEFRSFEIQDSWQGPYFGADWGFSCLEGNSLIKTKKGDKKIKDITTDDFVLTRDGFKKVMAKTNKGIKKVVELDFGYGKMLVTPDHRVFTGEEWKRVDELRETENLCVIKYNLMAKLIKGILRANTLIIFIVALIRRNLYYIGKFGSFIMEKSREVSPSITLTLIRLTTVLKTLFVYPQKNTLKFIIIILLAGSLKRKCQRYDLSVDIQKKTGNKEELNLWKRLAGVLALAKNAVKKSLSQMFIKSSVAQIVEKDQILEIVKKNILAKTAALNLWLLRMTKGTHVLQNVRIRLRQIKEEKEVFDISTENKEFFSNDLLVHNCDPSTLVKVYIDPIENILYIRKAVFGYHVELNDLPKMFDSVTDSRRYKILADCSRPETISHVRRSGFHIDGAKKWKGSVEDGIEWLKSFSKIVIHTDCPDMKDEAIYYSYKVDKLTGLVTTDIVDAYNHGWDAVRYACEPMINKNGISILSSC